jgi:hypothetical protein
MKTLHDRSRLQLLFAPERSSSIQWPGQTSHTPPKAWRSPAFLRSFLFSSLRELSPRTCVARKSPSEFTDDSEPEFVPDAKMPRELAGTTIRGVPIYWRVRMEPAWVSVLLIGVGGIAKTRCG